MDNVIGGLKDRFEQPGYATYSQALEQGFKCHFCKMWIDFTDAKLHFEQCTKQKSGIIYILYTTYSIVSIFCISSL